MENPYIEAKQIIWKHFDPFWDKVGWYLPDSDYFYRHDYDDPRIFYSSCTDMTAEDVLYLQNEYHKMANVILETVMYQHNVCEICIGLEAIDDAVKEALKGDFMLVLDPCFQLFSLFQRIRRVLHIVTTEQEA